MDENVTGNARTLEAVVMEEHNDKIFEEHELYTNQKVRFAAILVALMSCLFALFYFVGSADTPCNYEHQSKRCICTLTGKRFLETLPEDIPAEVVSLSVYHELDGSNRFSVIRRSNFSSFGGLVDLVLVRCGIEQIEADAFSHLSELRLLDLRHNRIRTLPETVFAGLNHLSYLDLLDNMIQFLGDNTFRDLTLRRLALTSNRHLAVLSPNVFARSSVRQLQFSSSIFRYLNTSVLYPLRESLVRFELNNHNGDLVLENDIFNQMNLTFLKITNSGLRNVNFLTYGSFSEIILDGNNLGRAKFNLGVTHKITQKLSLSNCNISRFPANIFLTFPNIQHLNISQNKIQKLESINFPNSTLLKSLDMSFNQISQINGNFSHVLEGAIHLDIRNNSLTNLPVGLVGLLTRLEAFEVSGNAFHCNCLMEWLLDWLEDGLGSHDVRKKVEEMTCLSPRKDAFKSMSDGSLACRPATIINATIIRCNGVTSLICISEGDPMPNVTWSSPTNQLLGFYETSSFSYEQAVRNKSWLELFKVPLNASQFHHAFIHIGHNMAEITEKGNYTCRAWNVAGTDVAVLDTSNVSTPNFYDLKKIKKIEILTTPHGFFITAFFIVLIGYIIKTDEPAR